MTWKCTACGRTHWRGDPPFESGREFFCYGLRRCVMPFRAVDKQPKRLPDWYLKLQEAKP